VQWIAVYSILAFEHVVKYGGLLLFVVCKYDLKVQYARKTSIQYGVVCLWPVLKIVEGRMK